MLFIVFGELLLSFYDYCKVSESGYTQRTGLGVVGIFEKHLLTTVAQYCFKS